MNQTKRIQPLDAKQNLTNNKNNTRRRHDKDKTKEEILPENRSRQDPEKGANPDGSGRGKIPGLGGRQDLVTF